MTKDSQDTLARAYAMLSALRKNISQMKTYDIEEKYVTEFHNVLDKLEGVGIETAEFRVPETLVKPKITASWLEGDVSQHEYSEEKYVERSFILTKIDAVLSYFEIITSEKPRKMGFSNTQD
jgi:hypothetical protein